MELRKLLIALAIHYQGDWEKMFAHLIKKEGLPEDTVEGYLKYVKSGVLTIVDAEYPSYLRNMFHPPFVLFYYGDISLINKMEDNVAVVGGRYASQVGRENVNYIVSGIAKRFNVVSGLAIGIDSVAHRAAINAGGRTIGVLANGIEYCYPSINSELYETIKKHHLVISEYFGYISPEPNNFHQRNRLIAYLSRGTIIGESTLRSGTSITATLTQQMNRDLLAIPSSDIYNSLCNVLIKDGCAVALSPEEVIEYLEFGKKSLLCDVK